MEDKNFLSEIAEELNSAKPDLQNANDGETVIQEEKVEEQVVEEQPVATEEPQQEEVKEEAPSEPSWYEKEEEPVTAKAEEPVKEETPKVEEDPDIELIRKYKKSGKSLRDFVNDYKVEDYSAMEEKDLVKKGLEEFYGLDGEELNNAVY